jgi:hypothetical protein
MKQLSRKYNNCKNTCYFPIQCLFNESPVFYTISGNYTKETSDKYNTILVFTEDVVVQTFITINVYITLELAIYPGYIIYSNYIVQPPGIYPSPAGTEGYIIKSYFNLPNC